MQPPNTSGSLSLMLGKRLGGVQQRLGRYPAKATVEHHVVRYLRVHHIGLESAGNRAVGEQDIFRVGDAGDGTRRRRFDELGNHGGEIRG